MRIAFFGLLPLRLKAMQILYRTTDLNGEPETTVTTVLIPQSATAQSPVMAYQCAIDAVSSRAFPSFGLLPGSFGLNQTQNELMLMVAALAQGWILSVSDHEGPLGLWMVAEQPGFHVLDGVRATLAAAPDCDLPALSPDTPIGLWGYSGGGTATAWAAQLAAEYAPELNVVGALIGAPAAQPGSLVHYHNKRFASGMIIPVLAALMRAHPTVHDFLSRHLNNKGRKIIEKAVRMSLIPSVLRWPFADFGKFIVRPLDEVTDAPAIAEITDRMVLGRQAPKAPVYLYHAVHDQLLPIAPSDQLAEDYALGGTHVTYRRDRASEHISLAITGGADALAWLADRVAGTPLPPGPDVRTVFSTSLTAQAIRGLLRWQWGIIEFFTGRL